jgi:uncharacterized integral membrane protein
LHGGSYNLRRMRILVWLVRASIFFTLFAFALNNQQPVVVNWFFGVDWSAPLVIVVLAAFGAGCVIGVLAMVPTWWRQRRAARRRESAPARAVTAPSAPPSGFDGDFPPRESL